MSTILQPRAPSGRHDPRLVLWIVTSLPRPDIETTAHAWSCVPGRASIGRMYMVPLLLTDSDREPVVGILDGATPQDPHRSRRPVDTLPWAA